MKSSGNWFERIQEWVMCLNAVILILIMSIVFIQTVTRYVVFYSIPWSEEASRYLYVALTLLGVNVAITKNQFVSIDLIDNALSEKNKQRLEFIRQILAFIIASVFFYSSFGMIEIGGYQMSPALRLPMNIMYGIVSLGFGLTVLSILFQMKERCFKHGKEDVQSVNKG
ncbi:TRAP transporter small permease [Megasphaera sp. DISK 18]|uniref:TRAP transporter small permease n=1 Tax=Megasphaera sp. DISK 18 TaxID=1776081 RepID=UPI000807070A|nr:TRAP transporter small permease [Megasphaera sp. DISK 18]OBZ33585.1 TRAP transporter [Megasphaera sp. DISK 18]